MLQRRALIAASSALALQACTFSANADHEGPNAPRFDAWGPFGTPDKPRFKRALVLSSGGPRGFVHVGVAKALDQLGFMPDLIVGSSAGALVGVLLAARVPVAEIERLALELGASDLLRLNPMGGEAASLSPLVRLVNEALGGRRIEQLPIPFVATVMQQNSREVIAYNCGDAGVAVQASCAIEGRVTPVKIRGQTVLDADLAEPMPVRRAKALGAAKVLAVDASAHEWEAPAGSERWRAGDLRKRALTKPDAAVADVLLHPKFDYYVSLSRDFRLRTIAAGERDTLAAAERIRTL
jgi:NTE family protein